MKYIFKAFFTIAWVCGVVIAQGFWSTLLSVVIPFWSWYLVAEKVLQVYGFI